MKNIHQLKNIASHLLLCAALFFHVSKSQSSAGSAAVTEPRFLVDLPTAGMIPAGKLAFDADFYEAGGLLVGASVGALDCMLIGISYGGGGLVGSEKPSWNPSPGYFFRIRIVNETVILPAIALGFESQGKGPYIDSISGYSVKSQGFYAAASKNYSMLGNLSLHAGINYSLEKTDGGQHPNLFAGAEKSLGPVVSLMLEYNPGFNEALGKGRGYLNAGMHIALGGGLTVGINVKDLLKSREEAGFGNRTITLEYVRNL